MRRVSRALGVAMLAGLLATALPDAAAAQDERCFAETGACLGGRFRQYWEQNGGLTVFGFPLGPAREERNRDNGQTYLTQWFERARFELHAENQAPYDVLLGRLGDDQLVNRGVDWRTSPGLAPGKDCQTFATSHAVCDSFNGQPTGFRAYWSSHGLADPKLDAHGRSLALFGMPLTDPQYEFNSSGDWVIAQYFERARFERAVEAADGQVTLGRLGAELSANRLPLIPLIRQEPTAFFSAADDSGLVWASHAGDNAMTLYASDLAGQGRRVIAEAPQTGLAFRIDASHVYWTTAAGVYRAPRAGGPPETVAVDPRSPFELALDGDFVYWGNVSGQINRAPKAGGEPQTMVAGQSQIRALASDGTFVYWLTAAGEFLRAQRNGGAAEPLLNNLGAINSAQIALAGADVYVAYSYGDLKAAGRLIRLDRDGGPITLLEAEAVPLSLAASPTRVFWTTLSGLVKTAGGDGAAEILVTGQLTPKSLAHNPWGLYWLTAPGTIMHAGFNP